MQKKCEIWHLVASTVLYSVWNRDSGTVTMPTTKMIEKHLRPALLQHTGEKYETQGKQQTPFLSS